MRRLWPTGGQLRQKKKRKKDKGARVWSELEAGLSITFDFHRVLVPHKIGEDGRNV
jgi:hypothetical protein